MLTEWPSFPDDFSFSPKVRPGPNEICARIFERLDYFAWKNYLFCTPADKRQLEVRWYDKVPLNRDMPCTRIYVPNDSRKKGLWDDNYLCLPRNSGFPYRSVTKGELFCHPVTGPFLKPGNVESKKKNIGNNRKFVKKKTL